jgi:hypothetical protein
MDINTFLSERMTFNNFLFSMSFPDIVNYLERNPSVMSKVEWDLFTNSKIRASKNIDNYPELILKHSKWPWRFNMIQIQNELSRKISELSRLSKPSTKVVAKPISSKVEKENWIEKFINSMEKLCELQNKIKVQDSQIIINEIKKEVKEEEKIDKTNIIRQEILSRIINQEMPPEDPRSFSDDEEDFEEEVEEEELEEDFEEQEFEEEVEEEELEEEFEDDYL